MKYFTGFVLPVPADRRQAYLEHARTASTVFREHGVLFAVECWGDEVPPGELTDFYRAVDARSGEAIVFGWMSWASEQACARGMAAAMADPRLAAESNPMPFDGKRMIYGGFVPIVNTP
ncbi:MAG: DUF1428 domain-containing protein [Deltaproteobacteria bacterium]|nr:MAG: DUF1428 domain-containing protein [Deltaproteobacteria bacterium]